MSIETGFDYTCYTQPIITLDQAQRLRAAGMERCALALDQTDATIQTAANLSQAGINLDGYRELSGDGYAAQALDGTYAFTLLQRAGVANLRRYWLTAESDASEGAAWVTSQLQAAVAAVQEYQIGIYTGYWYWLETLGLPNLFPSLPVWGVGAAGYNGIAALPAAGFGGWTAFSAYQYASPVIVIPDLPGLDLDVFGL